MADTKNSARSRRFKSLISKSVIASAIGAVCLVAAAISPSFAASTTIWPSGTYIVTPSVGAAAQPVNSRLETGTVCFSPIFLQAGDTITALSYGISNGSVDTSFNIRMALYNARSTDGMPAHLKAATSEARVGDGTFTEKNNYNTINLRLTAPYTSGTATFFWVAIEVSKSTDTTFLMTNGNLPGGSTAEFWNEKNISSPAFSAPSQVTYCGGMIYGPLPSAAPTSLGGYKYNIILGAFH